MTPDYVCGQDGCDRCDVCPVPIPADALTR